MTYAAITTNYFGYTNRLSSRVKATARKRKEYSDGEVSPELSLTANWQQDVSADDNHTLAAKALAKKLGWAGVWICGGLPDGTGNCYVRLFANSVEPDRLADLGIENRDWFYIAEKPR